MRVPLLTRTSAELPGLPSLRSSICRWEPANLNTYNQTHISTPVHANTVYNSTCYSHAGSLGIYGGIL